jgi:intracellular sulfur oxidation DsrE/DsrF family protein
METHMKKILSMLLLLIAVSASYQIQAAEDNKPFAEERIVLQISDPNPLKQTLVLNVASNLIKHYGQDKVDIEIVAFGPGLRLMFKDNANSSRISGLTSTGVTFAACGNTIEKMAAVLGHTPELHSSVGNVPGGAVRIIDLQNQGFKLLKP